MEKLLAAPFGSFIFDHFTESNLIKDICSCADLLQCPLAFDSFGHCPSVVTDGTYAREYSRALDALGKTPQKREAVLVLILLDLDIYHRAIMLAFEAIFVKRRKTFISAS